MRQNFRSLSVVARPEGILVPNVCGNLRTILVRKVHSLVYDMRNSAEILVRLNVVSFFFRMYLRLLLFDFNAKMCQMFQLVCNRFWIQCVPTSNTYSRVIQV